MPINTILNTHLIKIGSKPLRDGRSVAHRAPEKKTKSRQKRKEKNCIMSKKFKTAFSVTDGLNKLKLRQSFNILDTSNIRGKQV